MDNREELNKAIATVITTKYKKDAKEAHKIVEQAGYRIDKYDGRFEVCNSKTYRSVCVAERRVYNTNLHRSQYIDCVLGCGNKDVPVDRISKIDFVEVLNKKKPDLSDWNWNRPYSKAIYDYECLRGYKYSLHCDERRIKEIKQKIESLQSDLERLYKNIADTTITIEKFRMEHGLKGGKTA